MGTEAWLEGPLEGVDPYLMPVAQALVQVERDLRRLEGLAPEVLWARPGGAASVGFLGLLHQAAEHAVRHTGQALTTAKTAGGT